MAALWDTTLASRLHPDGEVFDYVVARAADSWPVRIGAPTILELAYGYQRVSASDVRFAKHLDWLTRLIASDAFMIVPLGGRAALVAGRLRGLTPHPPARRDRRSKTMRQASWLLDIQIAATAFAAGLDVATDNRADFEDLRDALTHLYPQAPPMAVLDGPR